MKEFAKLYEQLDQTSSTLEKVERMKDYFSNVPPEDAAWALFFLSGKRLKRLIGSKLLHEWCLEESGYPDWLYQECYAAVGDTAEVITLILPETSTSKESLSLSEWMEERILPLKDKTKQEQKKLVCQWWKELNRLERFILNKILTGSLRVGVSYLLTLRALQQTTGVSRIYLSQRLIGGWQPTKDFFLELSHPEQKKEADNISPFPFFLASPLDKPLEELGEPFNWQVEWKWDGIRSQIVRKKTQAGIWSRSVELINEQFPELLEMAFLLPEVILDGEILAYRDGKALPFAELQKRLNRKKPSQEYIKNVPISFMAYDLIEWEGEDKRLQPLIKRRQHLSDLISSINHPRLILSPVVSFKDWIDLEHLKNQARSLQTEGLMLKNKDSPYGTGRQKGNWWKFKISPMTIDAVLMYAQPGSGRRASLFTDYTFGVWQNEELIPLAKAYSGLSQEEIKELDAWIRKNTQEKFGPVRQVKPFHVFELAFEGIQQSNRHKSGIAVRFPRIQRWRKDKKAEEADQLESVKTLLKNYET